MFGNPGTGLVPRPGRISTSSGSLTMLELGPLGDRAFLARFATEDEAARWVLAVRARGWAGIEDVVLAYQTAAVHADPDRVDLRELEERLRTLTAGEQDQGREGGRRIVLPVLY